MYQSCHHCDYDLIGLPDKGNCPECGEFYDKHSSYRTVRGTESTASRHVVWVSLAIFTLIVLMVGATIAAVSKQWGALALTLVIAGVSGFGSFAYWWSERAERRGAD
jgi:hypothetical protein